MCSSDLEHIFISLSIKSKLGTVCNPPLSTRHPLSLIIWKFKILVYSWPLKAYITTTWARFGIIIMKITGFRSILTIVSRSLRTILPLIICISIMLSYYLSTTLNLFIFTSIPIIHVCTIILPSRHIIYTKHYIASIGIQCVLSILSLWCSCQLSFFSFNFQATMYNSFFKISQINGPTFHS